ncbi:MAG: VWA domain-containing protein [Pseudomonadota bacterium]
MTLSSAATAQERPSTILVLDGSGSMWGQIDGVNKIVIAREVIGGILGSFPPEQSLGLTVYGHRRKGDCNDIETLIAPGLNTAPSIIDAVNGINPRGKTPLSAAVMAAAEALRFTEEKATVILVSDGIETCNVDPCAVGQQLEQLGVDFTAHVIGFDVDEDPAARAQLQCLAEETGGTFLTASNASELTNALQTVAEPALPVQVRFQAIEGDGGPQITAGLSWNIADAGGTPILANTPEAAPALTLPPGGYVATVTRSIDGAQGSATVSLEDSAQVVTIALPELVREFELTLRATDGENGPAIDTGLRWRLTNGLGIPVLNDETNARPVLMLAPGRYTASVTRDEDGAQGTGEITIDNRGAVLTIALPELVRPYPVTFLAKANGLDITAGLAWSVSDASGALILQDDSDASPMIEAMPGAYTARVVRLEDGAEASADFSVVDASQTVILTLPDLPPPAVQVRAVAIDGRNGPRITDPLIWDLSGPDGAILTGEETARLDLELVKGTYTVSVTRPADGARAEERFGVGSVNKTVTLELPEYRPLATVLGPDSAPAGSTIPVEWTGPDEQSDYIAVSRPDSDKAETYTYTREGPLLDLTLPPEPGRYEIRYVLRDGRKVLASQEIEVTEVTATIAYEGALIAGNTLSVDWTGPDYQNDYLAVIPVDDEGAISYTYSREGSPLGLVLPSEPGEYRLAYIMSQRKRVLETLPITVSEITASLTSPGEAAAGATVAIDWTGPDYQNDYIAVVPRGAEKVVNYTYTRQGSPLDLVMPAEPGSYDIVYVMANKRRIIAREPVEVVDVLAALDAAATGAAGATLSVDWTGPDYQNDYIGVFDAGGKLINYTYTRQGSPLGLVLPVQPGAYTLAYVQAQGRTVLASQPISVEETQAQLDLPADGTAGETVEVTWTGPDYRNDFIAVLDENGKTINYTYTRQGSPLGLVMPTEPGTYEVAYVVAQDRTIIARQPITVSAVAATLDFAAEGTAGETMEITWTGPDYRNDFIAVLDENGKTINYTYTRQGSPLGLVMPTEPGTYEVAYVVAQDRTIIARETITVSDIGADLRFRDGPLNAGETLEITWTGPDYRNDFIAVLDENDKSVTYTYSREGTPLGLMLPSEPGNYEIAYVMAQDRKVLTRVPITVSAIEASITPPAPDVLRAGATITLDWAGPDYRNDFIAVTEPGENRSISYGYTRQGNPLEVTLPAEPGEYDLVYIMAQNRTPIARIPISVSAVEASVSGPVEAPMGSTIEVSWEGPGYTRDVIAIAPAGEADDRYLSYANARNGSPAELVLPVTPGTYELRYVMTSNSRVVLARVPITLTPVTAAFDLPPSAAAGTTLEVSWEGPDYRGDTLQLVLEGANRAALSLRTRGGSPARLDLPDTPGTYELHYVLGQGATILHTQTLVVE